ncbi:MAG TPA: CBS domain-containing protein [Patescibacteria group bacterium]|jgi:CBS domain-containing protein|nr:CBS domain-containing protein [Patescibacteria group bacterium]
MLTVRDVMTHAVKTVRPETPLKDVARVLLDRGISGVPVVDAKGTVLGVVSEADFLIKEQGARAVRHRRLETLLGESAEVRTQRDKLAAGTAGQAMTAPAVTVAPTCAISDAAAIMTSRRINRLPVVDKDRLVGIVSRADLVRAYLRTDEELVQTIREDVLLRILWLDPAGFTVEVRNGEATVRGTVERRSTAAIVAETIRLVPGIVNANVDVNWTLDDRDVEPATRSPEFPYGIH